MLRYVDNFNLMRRYKFNIYIRAEEEIKPIKKIVKRIDAVLAETHPKMATKSMMPAILVPILIMKIESPHKLTALQITHAEDLIERFFNEKMKSRVIVKYAKKGGDIK